MTVSPSPHSTSSSSGRMRMITGISSAILAFRPPGMWNQTGAPGVLLRMLGCFPARTCARRMREPCLKAAFAPGISDEMTITTTPDMGITHLGPNVPSMYSTPSMVQLIEGTCVRLISRYVDEGEQSVGFRVDVKHLAP